MFKPKTIVFYIKEKPKLLDFSKVRKKGLLLLAAWSVFILSGAAARISIDLFVATNEINALRTEKTLANNTINELKTEYNYLAKIYLEEQKIARVVSSINPWLEDDHIELWVKMLKRNGSEVLANLNETSRNKIEVDTTHYSLRTGVSLLLAVSALESDFRLDAESGKDAFGPMQLRKITARHIGLSNRKDPVENMNGGTKYLAGMLKKYYDYPDQLELALASYNAGVTRVGQEWISAWGTDWRTINHGLKNGGSFKETRDYVSTIVAMSKLFNSGKWSDMDKHFWSTYRRSIFNKEYATRFGEVESKVGAGGL